MVKAEEELVAGLLAAELGVTFESKSLDLGSWGKVDRFAILRSDLYLLLEVERGQKHPSTNVAKLWPWLAEAASPGAVLAHVFVQPNKIPHSRIRLASWLGQKMERELSERFAYRSLAIHPDHMIDGIDAVRGALRQLSGQRQHEAATPKGGA